MFAGWVLGEGLEYLTDREKLPAPNHMAGDYKIPPLLFTNHATRNEGPVRDYRVPNRDFV